MATGIKIISAALLVCMLPNLSAQAASGLDDPTRPAFELVPGLDGQIVDANKAPAAPSGLQSVILAGKREAAIINGVEVEVGKKYGNATLVVVNETCVVLMGPEGRQVMHMYPSVNLSKTEQACAGRRGLPTIKRTVAQKKPKKKPAKAKKKVVTCVDDDTKDGSGK
ncbi:MAG: hypothetical protein KJ850_06980 [Gammaproteobacteria bacterium]|nr:hypothetical protein [Gammaproteobacteria bacterium]MBU1624778.1 hypothetical protein [Gammaproteobacteria bacterium]MBU1982622.1 hypothetical protein [Gammaproteobacteria bacterium]